MVHNSKQKILDTLGEEIKTSLLQQEFDRFKKAHPEFAGFNTSKDLITFFNAPDADIQLKDQLLYLLVSHYQISPKQKGWLMTLLLLVSYKQMEQTFYRIGFSQLELINSYDLFAPVYESYINAFLDVSSDNPDRFALHLKDRAEYLIWCELKDCGRFKGEPDIEIPAPEELPWQTEIEEMIREWTIQGILTKKESELVVHHIIYEYTFKELSEKGRNTAVALRQQFHRAISKLKPYLTVKYLQSFVTK
jgi:hypothetical protein